MTVNQTVSDSFDQQLATLTRVQDTPEGTLNYGRDLSCVQDLTENFAETDPNSAQGIAEAVIRRLTCPRGGLIDDPDYGIDLKSFLNHGTTDTALRSIETRAINEASKDERVATVDITVAMDAIGYELLVTVSLTPNDPALRPFQFVFAVTSSEVLIQTIGA